ncbi:MAG: cation:proton antiporter [Prolixibacteraceae bacterium]|nr:cation:proton antiporter [Prolixibacteraceae bacterium]
MENEILNLLLVLVAAWLGGIAANRMGYPGILGELVAGIVFGPAILGFLHDSAIVASLSEVGILLLMAYIGMEIDLKDLKKASWYALLTAIGSFIVPFILGYYTMILFGSTTQAALMVGLAISVTSLATKSRILLDLKLLNTRIASVLMLGALFTDTIALVSFAGIVSFADAGAVHASDLLMVGGKALLFFAFTFAFGMYLLPVIGRLLDKFGFVSRTFYFTLLLIITLLFAELAELAGLHGILGAFIAGLFVREGVFNRKVTQEVNKVFYDVSIGFLAPVYFISVGFGITLDVFTTNPVLLISIIAVAVIGKIFGTALFYLPSGNGWREGITIGTGMNGRGVVEIIIAGIGLKMGLINSEIFTILVFMAIFTTLTVPFMLTWTTNWLRKRDELVHIEKRKGFIILGVNPLSLLLADLLKEEATVTLLDTNVEMVHLARDKGYQCIQGNALKEEVLASANASKAKTFIGLTRNTEINLLAAQLANDVYAIPEKLVLFSPGEEGAGIDLLEPIGASTLFARKTTLTNWTGLIAENRYLINEIVVKSKISTRKWVKQQTGEKENFLPLLIVHPSGKLRPYSYNDELEQGEIVKVLFRKA